MFMMQTGFLLLTVGSVRARSARSVCVKNVADAVFGGVAYYLFGYAFAYGDPINEDGTVGGNGFIGSEQFALSGTPSASYYNFVFQVCTEHVLMPSNTHSLLIFRLFFSSTPCATRPVVN